MTLLTMIGDQAAALLANKGYDSNAFARNWRSSISRP
jgi:hypothetical protein